jgi:hypothetical protein
MPPIRGWEQRKDDRKGAVWHNRVSPSKVVVDKKPVTGATVIVTGKEGGRRELPRRSNKRAMDTARDIMKKYPRGVPPRFFDKSAPGIS